MDDDELFYCKRCQEEYLLPVDADQCPICGEHALEEV